MFGRHRRFFALVCMHMNCFQRIFPKSHMLFSNWFISKSSTRTTALWHFNLGRSISDLKPIVCGHELRRLISVSVKLRTQLGECRVILAHAAFWPLGLLGNGRIGNHPGLISVRIHYFSDRCSSAALPKHESSPSPIEESRRIVVKNRVAAAITVKVHWVAIEADRVGLDKTAQAGMIKAVPVIVNAERVEIFPAGKHEPVPATADGALIA